MTGEVSRGKIKQQLEFKVPKALISQKLRKSFGSETLASKKTSIFHSDFLWKIWRNPHRLPSPKEAREQSDWDLAPGKNTIWMFPKIVGFSPQIIHGLIGISIIFTIHFGVHPYFWKHPILRNAVAKIEWQSLELCSEDSKESPEYEKNRIYHLRGSWCTFGTLSFPPLVGGTPFTSIPFCSMNSSI